MVLSPRGDFVEVFDEVSSLCIKPYAKKFSPPAEERTPTELPLYFTTFFTDVKLAFVPSIKNDKYHL